MRAKRLEAAFQAVPRLGGGLGRGIGRGAEDAHYGRVYLAGAEALADVAIGAGVAGGLHHFLIVAEAGEDDDGEIGVMGADDGNEGEAIDFRHADIEDNGVAGIEIEPGLDLRAIGKGGAGVAFAAQVGHEKPVKEAIIVDDKEVHKQEV